jgi:hypothetical protein
VFVRREDAGRFIAEVRLDDPELAMEQFAKGRGKDPN